MGAFWSLFSVLFAIAAVFGAKVTAAEAASKWSRRLGGASEDIRRGIERVQEAPGVAAARQQPKMLAKVTEAITSGRWARNTAAVTVQEWRTAAIDKGLPRIASGAAAAEPKMASFMTELLPFVDSAVAKVKAMPSLSLDDNIARMTAYVRQMATFKRTR